MSLIHASQSGFLAFVGNYPRPITLKQHPECHPPAFMYYDEEAVVAIHHKNDCIGKEDEYLIGFEKWGK